MCIWKVPAKQWCGGLHFVGEFGVELRCAGYDGLVISGESKKPVYLFVKDG